jgi:hypothetical protein
MELCHKSHMDWPGDLTQASTERDWQLTAETGILVFQTEVFYGFLSFCSKVFA